VGAGNSLYKFNAAGDPANFTATSSDIVENVGNVQPCQTAPERREIP
jgi:hypothetical protein